jgi:RNA polymerase sigma factor (sigma-70 family)
MTFDAPDAELVSAARQGSRIAFERLVARHQQAVRSFLRRACGDAADADDLAQDTFLAAWSGLWRYRGSASVRSWLCAIAWKKCLSFMRSSARTRRREDAAEMDPPCQVSPDDQLDLAAALLELPFDQRAAVALCLGGGFSHAEAAEVLAQPLGTIKSHVLRGRAKLLQALGGSDERS